MLGKTGADRGEPFPVQVPGEAAPISSAAIGEYVHSELFYYFNIYNHIKHAGSPFAAGWADWPPWLVQVVEQFDGAVEAVKRHNEAQAFKHIRRR